MKIARPHLAQVVEAVLETGAKQATKFVSPTRTVKATLHGKRRKNDTQVTMVLTVGHPNLAERRIIAACKKAGEPFPVKKLRLKGVPKRK